MKKDEKEYLTLGEVAEILGINKTTLSITTGKD